MKFFNLFWKSETNRINKLYNLIVDKARNSTLYEEWKIPDNLDIRFELLMIHIFIVLNRLKKENNLQKFSQRLVNRLFQDLDHNLRELGAADLGVKRRIKLMLQGFSGRMKAYEDGISTSDHSILQAALKRNLFGTVSATDEQIKKSDNYLRTQVEKIKKQPISKLTQEFIWN